MRVLHAVARVSALSISIAGLALVSVIGTGVARASSPLCTETYTGSVSAAWNNASNWSPSSVPSTTDVACLSGHTVTIPNGASANVGAVDDGAIVADGPLTLNTVSVTSTLSALTVAAGLDGPTSATLNVDGDVKVDANASFSLLASGLAIRQPSGYVFSIDGSAPVTLAGGSVTTGSPLVIDDPAFLTSSDDDGVAPVTTTSTITFGVGVLVSANGGDSATFSAAGVDATNNVAPYGFQADSMVLTGGSSDISAGTTFETGPLSVQGGTLDVNGELNTLGNGVTIAGGTVGGNGTIDGNVTQTAGVVEPGSASSPDALKIDGDYFDGNLATLAIQASSPSSYDQLALTGTATVDGTIAVATGSYRPVPLTTFDIITGAESISVNSPLISPGDEFVVSAPNTSLVLTVEEPPSAPTLVVARAENDSASTAWFASATDGGETITDYTATAVDTTDAANGGQTCVYTVGNPYPDSCLISGLTVGDDYEFTVTATNSVAASIPSAPSATIVAESKPGAPGSVLARAGNANASVSWDPPASDGATAIWWYFVTAEDLTTSSNGGEMCSVFFTATSKNSCVVLGLTNGDLYDFTAYATNKLGTGPTSEPSNEVTPLPTPSVVVDPSRVVVPSTSSTVATCSAGVDTLTACSVVARANNGTVIASGSSGTVTSTPSVPVVLTVTARGAALAVPVGGITARVVATITTTGDVTEQVTSLVTLVAVNQQYTFSDASLFTGSSTKFSAKGSGQIGTFAKKLTGSKLVVCDGYTDNVGSVTADKALALDRARSVCTAFRSQTQKIEFVSFGQLHPVASNRTAAGRARNNRVVVKITN